MSISKSGKTLICFNVKNGQFKTASGSLTSLAWLTKFSKEKDLSTKKIFGDGELVLTLVNDKGFTGTIGMTAQDAAYNKALGFVKELSAGTGEVKQLSVVQHSIYFETDYCGSDGITKTKKTWVFGVEAQAPSETFDQNTDDINETNVEYQITIKGTNLKTADGSADYVDATTGQTVKVFTYSMLPDDVGYATFGDSVPVPKVPAATPVETPAQQ